MDLLPFVANLIDRVHKFPTIDHILVTPSEDSVDINAMARDNTVLVRGVAPRVEHLNFPICFGNLKYLSSILRNEEVKNGGASWGLEGGESVDGSDIHRTMIIQGPRTKITYEATDANAADIVSRRIKVEEWPVEVDLETGHSKLFSDAMILLSAADPRAESFTAMTVDGSLFFCFGQGNKTIDIRMADVEGELEKEVSFNASDVNTILKMLGDNEVGKMYVGSKALHVEISGGDVDYTYTVPKVVT